MADKLDEFFKKRIVPTEPAVWQGPFPDPYKPLTAQEAAEFEAENKAVISRMKSPSALESSKPIQVGVKVKEVARPVEPEVQAVADVSKKLTDQDIQDLKRAMGVASPMAEVSTSESVQMPVQPTAKDIDLKAIREKVEAEGPKLSMTDALLGLIPVGIDVLTGGYGAPLEGAGQYYLGKVKENEARKQKLEDFLLETEKARAVAGAKKAADSKVTRRFQAINIVDPNTLQSIKANYDTTTGKYSLPDGTPLDAAKIRTAYAVIPEESDRRVDYRPRLDPETGLYSRIEGGKMVPLESQQGELNPKQQKDLQAVTSKFISSDAYKKPAETLRIAGSIDELVQTALSGNPTAANIAIKEIAKLAEGGGKLSDSDVALAQGSPSFKAKAKRFANLQATDLPLTPSELQDLQEIAAVMSRNSRRKLKESLSSLEESYVKNYGGKRGAVSSAMSAYVPSLYNETPVQPRREMPVKPQAKKSPVSSASKYKNAPSGMTFEEFKAWKAANE